MCVLLTGAAYAYVHFQWGEIPDIGIASDILGRSPEGSDEDPGDVMNVLLVGSDTRDTLSDEDQKRFNTRDRAIAGSRADTIMVLHIDPRETQASILSIPRDLYIPLAGTSRTGRINQAFDGEKGPENLVLTIENNLGIDIDHIVQIDFNGFRGVVDTVGGVNGYFPSAARDRVAGLHVPEAGCVKLDGEQALAFVRSRHYEYQDERGRWRSEGGIPDFNRIQRQQEFLRRIMGRAISKAKNPATANALIRRIVTFVQKDEALGLADVAKIGLKFRSLDPSKVEMLTLPTTPARKNGASVLVLKQPDADGVLQKFKGEKPDDGPAAVINVSPSSVTVRVLNGSGVGGQAATTAEALSGFDFQVSGTGNAPKRLANTIIVYGPNQRDKALLLQTAMKGGARLQADASLRGVDVVLMTGSDFTGVQAPAATGTPTTQPPATTTTTVAEDAAPEQPECKP
jgi:LCP family protein required for cell wall assembly